MNWKIKLKKKNENKENLKLIICFRFYLGIGTPPIITKTNNLLKELMGKSNKVACFFYYLKNEIFVNNLSKHIKNVLKNDKNIDKYSKSILNYILAECLNILGSKNEEIINYFLESSKEIENPASIFSIAYF